MHCQPATANLPPQGWKIHISAAIAEAKAILRTAAPILVAHDVPFKFAADGHLLRLMNSKRWPRAGAGKFITAYPASESQFLALMEELDRALVGHNGPYILSDHRYKNDPVLYYRYGGFLQMNSLMVNGLSKSVVMSPDGSAHHDQRLPYFNDPQWAEDPLGGGPSPEGKPSLQDGRYLVTAALSFATSGGVYKAIDNRTNRTVVIKEARPFTNVQASGNDAMSLLKKEHRLLTLLSGSGIAPEPIDFFREWEHCFLVEEFFEGQPLRYYTAGDDKCLALNTRIDLADTRKYYEWFCRTYTKIARLFEALHERNIVFCDVSHYNILVEPNSGELRMIDFEAAYEAGVDEPTPLFTPGFAPGASADGLFAQREDDHYGLGALMLAALMPINALIYVKPEADSVFLSALVRDLGLPETIKRAVSGLMAADRNQRMTAAQARTVLSEPTACREPAISDVEAERINEELLNRLCSYLLAFASYDREDRLFPADPAVFSTNPLSVAYGACGVAWALWRLNGAVPEAMLQWMDSHPYTPEQYPPGLYVGLAGLAWVHLELGLVERATEFARMAASHPLLLDCPDLFYGMAGWGMTALKFFHETKDELFLKQAIDAGDFLLRTATHDEHGDYWPSQGKIYYGLGHGASGVSLFLLYLYLATRGEQYLEGGKRGLEYELAHSVPTSDGGLSWRLHEGHPTITPYLRYGGAGVGMTLLRYWKVTGEQRYWEAIKQIVVDADRKYAIFPGRFFGLSGMGEFLLDLAQFTGDQQYAAKARKVAAGIMLFAIDAEEGVAFPGEELMRITCDFATGSSGVGIFLERLLRKSGAAFMLDELFGEIPLQMPEPAYAAAM